jgi:hypothetical protein
MNDKASFRLYCIQCTDAQLLNVYEKERIAKRAIYVRIALEVMTERGIA